MKTLAKEADRRELVGRMEALDGMETALFGKMMVELMICHVREAYLAPLAGSPLTAGQKIPLPPAVVKWLALKAPMKWRPGTRTALELEPGQPGTVPVGFAEDKAKMIAATKEFAASMKSASHPFFGTMCREDWLRWGWLHADHHLRQFGR